MSEKDTFGPRLRAERERRGITLDTIASVTKVSADLWDGLEHNDFSRWPSGIFARAFVRDYARAVGLDSDDVVNEFCRLFPIGDRRASRLIQAQAELIGHPLAYSDAAGIPPEGDRRAPSSGVDPRRAARAKFAARILAVAIDLTCTVGLSTSLTILFRVSFLGTTGVVSLLYYSAATVGLGVTPGTRIVSALRQRMPTLFTIGDRRRATA